MKRPLLLPSVLLTLSCARAPEPVPARPSILLVTLDTTRADAVGPETTPALEALGARGARFRQAYAAAPETLPSTRRCLTGSTPPATAYTRTRAWSLPSTRSPRECSSAGGYRTAAFVSSFVLARRFGLARGFDVYDDALPDGRSERAATETTDRALALPPRPPRPRRASSGSTTSTPTRRTSRPIPTARASR